MLNFSAAVPMGMGDAGEAGMKKHQHRPSRDPMSHRIIEKRRRDRMNNCLADLSQLIPTTYLKQGQGRIEKTEIIEMAIKHIKQLQAYQMEQVKNPVRRQDYCEDHFHLGFQECMDEVMRFLVEVKGLDASSALCLSLLAHLKQHNSSISVPEACPAQTSNLPSPPEVPTQQELYAAREAISSSSEMLSVADSYPQFSETDCEGRSSCDGMSAVMRPVANQLPSVNGQPGRPISPPLSLDLRPEGMYAVDSSSGYSSTPTVCSDSHQQMARSDSDSSRGSSTYKFKNHIKLRFSADEEVEKSPQGMAASDSGSYFKKDSKSVSPNCDAMSSTDTSRSASRNSSPPKEAKHEEGVEGGQVPGFALHPNGTYYIPVVISMAHVLPYLNFAAAPSAMCHPISIPVVFSGPTVVSSDANGSSASGPTPATFTSSQTRHREQLDHRMRVDHFS